MIRLWKHKLQSGALQFTLFISVIILLLLAGIILLAYTHRFFIEQSKAIVDNIQLTDSGISALQLQDQINNDTISLPLKNARENQTVKIHLSQWGIFEKGYVKATHRKKTFTKCVLLGGGMPALERPAIYLADHYNPLAIVGNTTIIGNAMLPAQGVRPGNIKGDSYYGSELVKGKVTISTAELPKFKLDKRELLRSYLKEYKPQHAENFIPLGQSRKIINSFMENTKGYYSDEALILENMTLRGNIIIRSEKKITVRKSAHLNDIIIIAPEISIEDGVAGNFQAIADTSIKVGQDCRLNYPTALVLLEKADAIPLANMTNDLYNNKIFVGEGSKIKGTLCYYNSTIEERDFRVNIFLGDNAELTGEIYCDGNLELKACSVAGSVYTNYFVANEGGTIFVNHLYNAQINSTDLPEGFGGLLKEKQHKNVMQWLY